jgi:predicted Zn finger-like uncharacterized protein
MLVVCPKCSSQYAVDDAAFGPSPRRVRCSTCGHSWLQPPPLLAPAVTAAASGAGDLSAPSMPPPASAAVATAPSPIRQAATEPPPAAAAPVAVAAAAAMPREAPQSVLPVVSSVPTGQAPAGSDASETADLDFAEVPAEPELPQPELPQPELAALMKEAELAPEAAELVPPSRSGRERLSSPSGRSLGGRWVVPVAAAVAGIAVIGVLLLARDGIVRIFPGAAGVYAALGLGGEPAVGASLEFRNVTSRREWSGADEVLIVQGVIANLDTTVVPVPTVRVALYDGQNAEVQAAIVTQALGAVEPGKTVEFEARLPNPAANAQSIRVSFVGGAKDRPS